MCFVSKQEEKAVIKVPWAYMFTVCPKVEQELKTCLKKGCKKVQVDLAATEILTSAVVNTFWTQLHKKINHLLLFFYTFKSSALDITGIAGWQLS